MSADEGNGFIPGDSNKTVVMACTQPYWSVLQVGSQHLARQFARHGWQVHYISAPITPVHLARPFQPEVMDRFKSARRNPSIHENGRIYAYVPFSLIAPDGRMLLRSRPVARHWHKTMFPSFKRLLSRSGLDKPRLLYLDNLSYHFLLDAFPCSQSVFRVMDMHERFSGWKGQAQAMAQKIACRADLTIYSALHLKPYVENLGAGRSVFVSNGVDVESFGASSRSLERPACLRHIPDPVLLYTGMIDSRIDFDLIRAAASRLPQASFVFAGPLDFSRSLSKLPANVYFIGPVPHRELPALMHAAVAGLIPFDVKSRPNAVTGIRPLKFFEYMAAGIPVICARWPEIEELHSPAWFYERAEGFIDLVTKALNQEFDPEAARVFARQFDWKRSFEKLMSSLEPDC